MMRGKFKILILVLVFFGNELIFAEQMIIDDMRSVKGEPQGEYCENDMTRWCLVTDQVMGGVSTGILKISETDTGFFLSLTGDVSTKNNGGFIQIRRTIENHPIDIEFKGVRLKVRGNNQKYSVHVRTKYLFLPWQYYSAIFIANSKWRVVSIDFSEFSKSNFYQPNKFSSKDIKTIGIVAIGRDFKADVDIASIEFY